jgi:hypothetical protein
MLEKTGFFSPDAKDNLYISLYRSEFPPIGQKLGKIIQDYNMSCFAWMRRPQHCRADLLYCQASRFAALAASHRL